MPVPLSRASVTRQPIIRQPSVRQPIARPTPLPPAQEGGCCPACGGLECFCRPRFFAGQLLTDEDLNRLDQYMVAKQRHHNRYLHGWGVVCGLEVFCHPCTGYITVTAGTAISPCGEDIIVCANDAVNVCELLDRCGQRDRLDECDPLRPFGAGRLDDCRDAVEEWVLVVCYEERPVRGQMLLRQSTQEARCGRCGSGGCNGGCGCGCGGGCSGGSNGGAKSGARSGTAALATRRTPTVAPGQCEPTVLCETYRFELRKRVRDAQSDDRRTLPGGPAERFLECVQVMVDALPPPPPLQDSTKEQWHRWCCDLKIAIQEVLANRGLLDCTLADRFANLRCPNPAQFETLQAYIAAIFEQVELLVDVAAEWIRACFCSALLPPCPDPALDGCVPLATLRIRRADCTVLGVCAITERKQVLSAPAIEYYFAALPLGRILRDFLERFCCPTADDPDVAFREINRDAALNNQAQWTRRNAFARKAEAASPFGAVAGAAFQRKQPEVSPSLLLLDALGALGLQGERLLDDAERAHPFAALLLNQLAQPIAREFVPPRARPTPKDTDTDTDTGADAGAGAKPAEDVRALREVVAQQQVAIETMRKELDALRGARPPG